MSLLLILVLWALWVLEKEFSMFLKSKLCGIYQRDSKRELTVNHLVNATLVKAHTELIQVDYSNVLWRQMTRQFLFYANEWSRKREKKVFSCH